MARWRINYVVPGTKEEKQTSVDVEGYDDAQTLKNALEKGEVKTAFFTPGTIISVMKLPSGSRG